MALILNREGVALDGEARNKRNENWGMIEGEVQNYQGQIDQLVVDGDSSPEAAQARIAVDGTSHATLKARLDAEEVATNQQLVDTTTEQNRLIKKTKGIVPVSDYPNVQSAVDAATAGDTLYFESGVTYNLPEVTINKALRFSGYGATIVPASSASAFRFATGVAIERVVFEGFKFVGDGTTGKASAGMITNVSGSTVRQSTFRDLHFEKLPFGIYINSASAGYHEMVRVENCVFKDMVGGVSGSGLGVALTGGPTAPLRATLIGNLFDNCNRHSSYVSEGSEVLLIGNFYKNHRSTTSNDTSVSLAAQMIARCSHVKSIGNTFINNFEADIHIGVGAPSGTVDDVLITGNQFINSNEVAISVGSDLPDTNGAVKNISITGNKFKYKAGNSSPSILVQSAQVLNVSDNDFDGLAINATHYGIIKLYGFGASSPSGNYVISRNRINLPSAISTRGIQVDNSILTGTQKVVIESNIINATFPVYQGVAVTNANYKNKNGGSLNGTLGDISAGSALGTLINRVEVFNEKGARVGFIPIYNTI